MRVVIFLLALILPFFAAAESSCEKLNEGIYRAEVRVEPPGTIYKVHVRSRGFIYSAPDDLCRRGASLLVVIRCKCTPSTVDICL